MPARQAEPGPPGAQVRPPTPSRPGGAKNLAKITLAQGISTYIKRVAPRIWEATRCC